MSASGPGWTKELGRVGCGEFRCAIAHKRLGNVLTERQALGCGRNAYAMIVAGCMMMRISCVGIRRHFVAVAGPMAGIVHLDPPDRSEGLYRMRRRLSAGRYGEKEAEEKGGELMHDALLQDMAMIVVPHAGQSPHGVADARKLTSPDAIPAGGVMCDILHAQWDRIAVTTSDRRSSCPTMPCGLTRSTDIASEWTPSEAASTKPAR